ncbi:hypothetical protein D3C80_1559870 [compost metagenome]
MVFVPIARISASTNCLAASPTTTIDTTDAMPIIIPSMVSSVRILFAAIASQAMVNASRKPLTNCPHPVGGGSTSLCTPACFFLAGGLLTSSPSWISMIRSACAATCGSWVTIITVCP